MKNIKLNSQLISKIIFDRQFKKQKTIKTDYRNLIITKEFIDKKFLIYNGLKYFTITIENNMVGQKLGEFAPTRTRYKHIKKRKK